MADNVKSQVILRGEYKPKLDNGSDVSIPFEVHKFPNSSSNKKEENYAFLLVTLPQKIDLNLKIN